MGKHRDYLYQMKRIKKGFPIYFTKLDGSPRIYQKMNYGQFGFILRIWRFVLHYQTPKNAWYRTGIVIQWLNRKEKKVIDLMVLPIR